MFDECNSRAYIKGCTNQDCHVWQSYVLVWSHDTWTSLVVSHIVLHGEVVQVSKLHISSHGCYTATS